MKNNPYEEVLSILEDIANTASTNTKQAIIATHADHFWFRKTVFYALDPYKAFNMSGNITTTDLMEFKPLNMHDLFTCLDEFSAVNGLIKEAKGIFCARVQMDGVACVELTNRILNKDLRCGASTTLFRKAHKAFYDLPHHQPMKGGDKYDKFYKFAGNRKNICWSYKLDGTRTWAVVEPKRIIYLSSNGHTLPNFHVFDKELRKCADNVLQAMDDYFIPTVIFDGEVVNIAGDFSKHMSQFRRLNDMDPSGFRFRIFDLVIDNIPFTARYFILSQKINVPFYLPYTNTIDINGDDCQSMVDSEFLVTYMPHYTLDAHPIKLTQQAVDLGTEGVMLKTWDHQYEHKRSQAWCKMKLFSTQDLVVVDKVEGTGKHKGRLGALVIDREGVRVEVGSGYTDMEREEFWLEPPACIEVKYQDLLPSGSLRFPVFVRVRDDKA